MTRNQGNFKMGTVEMIVLYLLSQQDMYGYQIVTMIKKLSGGNVEVSVSTLYPTLYKLLENKYISDYETIIGKRRVRVYYHLEESGIERLELLLKDYETTTKGIEMILSTKDIADYIED